MFEKILDKMKGRVALADGGALIAKRGLVDGPGGYAGKKKRGPKINPATLKMKNKYSQHFFGKDYKDITYEQRQNTVDNYYKRSPKVFNVKSTRDPLTSEQQKLIKEAFPELDIKFTKGQKYGVIQRLKNGKINPEFRAINNFIARGYKKSLKTALPIEVQKEIISKFKLPKGVKEWNFDVEAGGNIYGVPGKKYEAFVGRIRNFLGDTKEYKVAADFGSPEGWMLVQMERAYRNGNKNYKPVYKKINGKNKIVGFKDLSDSGGGQTYYGLKTHLKPDGVLMSKHVDFANTKKYIDIANKVQLKPNKVIRDLLSKYEIDGNKVRLNDLLQYALNEKGLKRTQRALVLHHQSGANIFPTKDFQLLDYLTNQKIKGVEDKIRKAGKALPEDIRFLRDAGASVKIGNKVYGGGPKTAIGGFRNVEKIIQNRLKNLSAKEVKNLRTFLKQPKSFENIILASGVDPTQFNRLFPEVGNFIKEFGGDVGELFRKFGATKMGRVFAAIGVPLEVGFIALDMQPGLSGDVEQIKRNFAESYGLIPGVSKAIGAKEYREELAQATEDPNILEGITQLEGQKKFEDLNEEYDQLKKDLDKATLGGTIPPSGINIQKANRLNQVEYQINKIAADQPEFKPSEKGIKALDDALYRIDLKRKERQRQIAQRKYPGYISPVLPLPNQLKTQTYTQAADYFGPTVGQLFEPEIQSEQAQLPYRFYYDEKYRPQIEKYVKDVTYPKDVGTFKQGGLAALDEYKDYDRS